MAPVGPTPPDALRTFHVPDGDGTTIDAAHATWAAARRARKATHGWPDNGLCFIRENVTSHRVARGWPEQVNPWENAARVGRPPLVVFPDGRTYPDGQW